VALVQKSVLVGFPQQLMYRLVDEVERYPEFLPWCGGAEVEFRDAKLTRAAIVIDYHGIRQRFTTENRTSPPESIEIRLVSGPFHRLDGQWRFIALSVQACKIEFQLHYEFSGRLLEKLVGPVFKHIANTLVEAFVRRAEQVQRA